MILDTNALSAFIDGDEAVRRFVTATPRAAIPAIVVGEFRYGIAQSRHQKHYESWLTQNLPEFDILDVSEVTTLSYATVCSQLKGSGRPIPANDAWIAALAMQHGLPILSRDQHFDAVTDIRRQSW